MRKFLSYLLIFLGFFSISFAYTLNRQDKNLNSIGNGEKIVEVKKTSPIVVSPPKYLLIPDLSINLEIYPSQIKDNVWESTTKGISYLSTSPIPGEWGNSILYGHNWKSLLGNLVNAKVGQNIIIVYSDGTEKVFKISYIQEVYPYQNKFIEPSEDRRISLYTCSGPMDSKRFVVNAILDETSLLTGTN